MPQRFFTPDDLRGYGLPSGDVRGRQRPMYETWALPDLVASYSQKLSQLVRRGQRAQAALGHWIGGRSPYGYRRALRRPDGTVTILNPGRRWKARGEAIALVPDPLEAGIIHEIFEAYTFQGLGVRAIAERSNKRGVPPPASLRRRGVAAWPKGTIWTIVRNPMYVGRLVFGKARYREASCGSPRASTSSSTTRRRLSSRPS
jgi:hypothetical protein